MDKGTVDNLWEELKLLQPIIDKFDDITFKIKNWFITIFIAVTGYSIANDKSELQILNIFLILIFYFYEVTYRTAHKAFLTRCREVQAILRNDRDFTDQDKAPNIDRYLFQSYKISKDSKLLKFFLNRGQEKRRAEKNTWSTLETLKEAKIMLTQFRISFIYLSAFIVNIILAIFITNWSAIITSIVVIIICILSIRKYEASHNQENI
jgi:hypothetical protein